MVVLYRVIVAAETTTNCTCCYLDFPHFLFCLDKKCGEGIGFKSATLKVNLAKEKKEKNIAEKRRRRDLIAGPTRRTGPARPNKKPPAF